MKKIFDFFLFIIGLAFIEIGFASYVLISLLTLEYGFDELRNSILIVTGTSLLILGIVFMFVFAKESKKIKKINSIKLILY
jgi:hypothetical protein